jgi:general secretion pathway protein B
MSYILDALKKAEHQRDIGQVPGIGSEHPGSMTTRVSRWVYVLLFVLVINAGLLAYALWPESGSTSSPVSASSAAGSAVPTPLSPAVNPPMNSPRVEKPAASSVISRQAPTVATPPPAMLRPLPPLPPPEPAKTAQVETAGVTDGDADSGVRGEGVVSRPVVAVAATRPNDNLPVWPQVSGQLFREINSSLRMDVHVYSEYPEERFILINLKKYNEGEQLQEGPVVDEITPSGVILSFRGQRFRVQAQ